MNTVGPEDQKGVRVVRFEPGKAPANGKAASQLARTVGLVTEDAAAQLFADRYADRLRFCHDTGAWFEWAGDLWRRNELVAHFSGLASWRAS